MLLRVMPVDELNEWRALEKIDGPMDSDWRRDWNAASIQAQSAANASGSSKRVNDFMPEWNRRPLEGMSDEELEAAFDSAARLFGG